ncbi:dehydratase [Ornatilinea apprima]|uniref:Dehydratase n=1 Tax=Ornatilinea apprima TaxID=1134406 RepID=A0A0P6XG84_9CHLR|nr:aldo/keto reductase [Ornatilinea apprima]KPL78672.1 dehydratase [Ornatilinea apprima]
MEYRYLGRSGLKVSELCLGAMTFGRESSKEESFRIMDLFVEAGGNFIDTANVYSLGTSEEIVGQWLRGKQRDDLVIATKARFPMGKGPNDEGLSRKHLMKAVDDSLRRLGSDYIDLYQVHCWDRRTPLEETLITLDTLVKSGKVRYLGASNFTGWQLQKAIDLSRQMGLEAFTSLQPLYNLLDRYSEWELMAVCRNEGLGVLPWSPLRGGWLSGKYQRSMSAPPQGSRVEEASKQGWSEAWDEYANEHTWSVIDALMSAAKDLDKHPAQVAIRWLLQRPGVTSPIIGARKPEHLQINLGASGWIIPEAVMQQLNAASDMKPPYPYAFIRAYQRD